MQIKKLKLKNFAQHKSAEFNLEGYSLVGIFGSNGKGKSNLKNAIEFALRGELNDYRKGDRKISDIVHRTGDEEVDSKCKATVELYLRNKGVDIEIKRNLTAKGVSSRKVTIGDKTYTKQADSSRALEDHFGVSMDLLPYLCVAPQRSLDGFSQGDIDFRRELFTNLANTKGKERYNSLLKNKIAEVESKMENVVLRAEEAQGRLVDQINEVEAAQINLAQTKDHQEHIKQLRRKIEAIQDYATKREQLLASSANASASLALLEKQIKMWDTDFTKDQEASLEDNLCRFVKKFEEDLESFQQGIRSQQKYQRALKLLQDRQDLNKLKEDEVLQRDKQALVEKELALLDEVHLEEQRRTLEKYRESEKNLKEKLSDLTELTKRRKELSQEWTQLRNDWTNQVESSKTRISDNKQRLTQIQEESPLQLIALWKTAEKAVSAEGEQTCCPLCGSHSEKMNLSNVRAEIAKLETLQASMLRQRQNLEQVIREDEAKTQTLGRQVELKEADMLRVATEEEQAQLQVQRLQEQLEVIKKPENLETEFTRLEEARLRIQQLKTSKQVNSVQLDNIVNQLLKTEKIIQVSLVEFDNDWGNVENYKPAKSLDLGENHYTTEDFKNAIKELNNYRAELKLREDAVIQANEVREKLGLTEQDNDLELTRLLVSLEENQRQHDAAKTILSIKQGELNKINQEINEIEKEQEKNQSRREIVAILEEVITSLQPSGAARDYQNYLLGRTEPTVQRYLQEMRPNFEVRVDPSKELAFEFRRLDVADSAWFSMQELSGGQARRLGIAVFQAFQQTLAPRVGLLCLDEPSMGLDVVGRETLLETLNLIRESAAHRGHLCVCIDHHESLKGACDYTIEL